MTAYIRNPLATAALKFWNATAMLDRASIGPRRFARTDESPTAAAAAVRMLRSLSADPRTAIATRAHSALVVRDRCDESSDTTNTTAVG